MLCDHLEGGDREGGRETQEGRDMGIYVYIQLIHFVDRKSTRLNSSHITISYAVFCLKKKKV